MPDQVLTLGATPPRATTADFRERVRGALAGLPATAPLRTVWQALGRAGATAALYEGPGPATGTAAGAPGRGTGPSVDPGRLGELLTAVDARGDNGVTLGVLVQVASALPLAGSVPDGPAADAYRNAVAGSSVLALAATDAAAAGSDLAGLGTRITTSGGKLVLDGGKRWITGACVADHLLVLARHRPGRHFTSFAWVLVPADAPGVTVRPAGTDLLTGSATGHIAFDGVRLGTDHLAGRPGRGMASFARHMATERLAGAQWAVALVGRVLEDTRHRLANRTVDDRPLWHNDAVRRDFATCLVQLAQLRALCGSLARQITEHQDLAAAALLKSAVGLTVDPVLARCAQLQGADGLEAGGAQSIRAEAAVFGIGGGATELMLGSVADSACLLLAGLRS